MYKRQIVDVTVTYDNNGALVTASETITIPEEEVIVVEPEPETKTGVIRTTTFYTLEGDFIIEETDGGIHIDIDDNYRASSGLPGLYLYLTNNPNSTANAHEVGLVTTFNGAHEFDVEGVGINDFSHLLYFCKPFNVKVGDGAIED